jgi:hypothetical protein
MIYENKFQEWEENFNENDLVAFKTKARVNDFGVQLNLIKIIDKKDIKNAKIKKTTIKQPQKPIDIIINYSNNLDILHKIYNIVSKNQGNIKMTININRDKESIKLDSGFYINNNGAKILKQLDEIYIKI